MRRATVEIGSRMGEHSGEKKACYDVVPNRSRKRESRLTLVNWMALVTLAMSRAMQVEARR